MGTFPVSLRLAAFGSAAQDDPAARPGAGGAAPAGVDVYLAGLRFEPPVTVATVWKNGAALWRSSGEEFAGAEAVLMVGRDLYVAGWQGSRAMLWKNGRAEPLTDGSEEAWAGALAAVGGDLYAAGYHSNGTCNVATIWKNGVALAPLSNGLSHAQVNALAWVDGHLCAAGFVNDPVGVETAVVWINGKEQPALEEAAPGAVRGLAASGRDLYAVGYGGLLADRPRIWKNGRLQAPPGHGRGGANATAVVVSGPDVYVAGWEIIGERKAARVWKNGASLGLPGDPGRSSEIHALAVSGADLYSAGNLALETGKAAVWRNGQASLVGTGQRTEIKAIFLRPRG